MGTEDGMSISCHGALHDILLPTSLLPCRERFGLLSLFLSKFAPNRTCLQHLMYWLFLSMGTPRVEQSYCRSLLPKSRAPEQSENGRNNFATSGPKPLGGLKGKKISSSKNPCVHEISLHDLLCNPTDRHFQIESL